MRTLIIFLTIFITSGCSSVVNIFEDNKYFYKSGYQRVQLDSESKNVKNIHPIKISPQRIEGALKLVLTRFGSKPQQLFPNDRVYDYAIAISEALLEAKANEDVVFTLEGWYKRKGFSANRVTSGRIFYNKSGLNLVFGSILRKGALQETDPMLAGGLNEDLKQNPYVPGSRYQSIKTKYKLSALPNSGVFRPANARNRNDWLIFTKKALRSRGTLSQTEQLSALKSNIEFKGLRSEVESLRNELKSMRNPYQQNAYRNSYNQGNVYNNQPPPYGVNNRYNVQPPPYNGYQYPIQNNRRQVNNYNNQLSLKSLESMRERGLISEESYLKKLKELGY